MRRMSWWMVLIAALAVSVPAMAQTPPAGSAGPGTATAGPGASAPGPRVQRMRGQMLRRRVGLDEATAVRVEQILRQFDGQHAAVQDQVRSSRSRIRQLLRAKSADQAAYRQAVDSLRNAQTQQQTLRTREFDELKKVLTPKQQAQLLMQLQRLAKGSPGEGRGLGPCGGPDAPCPNRPGRGLRR